MPRVAVPPALAASHLKYCGEADRPWLAALPDLAEEYLRRWELELDGPARHGMVALVLPVLRADGTPAVLKLQHPDEENADEGTALKLWRGRGAVRLLDEDPDRAVLLLERLDAGHCLLGVPDDIEAVEVIAGLLGTLNAHRAPAGVRRLSDMAAGMLARVPEAARALPDPSDRQLLCHWSGAVREVAGEAGDRLLHWDLHYENVLARRDRPGCWVAIDPKPLAGDQGFELAPALWNRWPDVVASGDVTRAVRRRFDAMVAALGLDRDRAVAWTLGRALQNTLWSIETGESTVDPVQAAIAAAVGGRSGRCG